MKTQHIKICGFVAEDTLRGKSVALNAYTTKEEKS